MLHESLWKENADLAGCCLEHPFVRGLANGALDREAFRRYVAQDAFFLHVFFRAYALAAARDDDFDRAIVFHELMAGVVDELKLHTSYAETLGIDLDEVKPLAATSAYSDFLLRVASCNSVGEIIAALVPCMRLYLFLGTTLSASLRPDHPYAAWIEAYSSDDFGTLYARLETLLDDVASDSPAIRDAYRYAMQCELNFFSAALETAA